MNKTLIYVIVGVVVIGGILALTMSQKSTPDTDTNDQNQSTLKELLAMEGSQKCTVSSKTDTSESSGEVFVSGGMMRGNFTSIAANQTMESHMIVKSNTSYIWTDTMPQGFMMKLEETTSTEGTDPQVVDVNQKYTYDCDDWTTDEKVFELPSEINFMDAAQLIGNLPTVPEVSY